MATRATYNIEGTTYYCHWDGYRSGAALRFAHMIAALVTVQPEREPMIEAIEPRRGGAAFAFIRGNLDAEPAHRNSHNGHGDTEFAYNVEASPAHGYLVTVLQRRLDGSWASAAPLPLAEFVNRYGPDLDAPHIVEVQQPECYGMARPSVLATLNSARAIAALERKIGERFGEDNPNRASHLAAADAWDRAVAAADPVPA